MDITTLKDGISKHKAKGVDVSALEALIPQLEKVDLTQNEFNTFKNIIDKDKLAIETLEKAMEDVISEHAGTETKSDATNNSDASTKLNGQQLFVLILGMLLAFIFCFYAMKALDKGNHSVEEFIEDRENHRGISDILGDFD